MATIAITPDQDVSQQKSLSLRRPRASLKQSRSSSDAEVVGQQGMYKLTEWKGDLRPGGKWSTWALALTALRLSSRESTSKSIRLADSCIPGSRPGAVF